MIMVTKDLNKKITDHSRANKILVLSTKMSNIVNKYEEIFDFAPPHIQGIVSMGAQVAKPEVIEIIEMALNMHVKKIGGWIASNKEEESAINKFCMVAALEVTLSSPLKMKCLLKLLAEDEPERLYGVHEFIKHSMKPGAVNLLTFSEKYRDNESSSLELATAIVGWRRKVLTAMGKDDRKEVEPLLNKLLIGSKELEEFSEEDQPKVIHEMLSIVRRAENESRSMIMLRSEEGREDELPRLAVN